MLKAVIATVNRNAFGEQHFASQVNLLKKLVGTVCSGCLLHTTWFSRTSTLLKKLIWIYKPRPNRYHGCSCPSTLLLASGWADSEDATLTWKERMP